MNDIKNKNWKHVTRLFFILSVMVGFAQAAIITVDNNCSIVDAIQAANTNTVVGQCIAGDDTGGNDTVLLTVDIVLIQFADNDISFGRTGTPAITSSVILDGDGFTLERDGSFGCVLDGAVDAGEFRLLRVANPGNLDLRNIILINGCADGTSTDSKIGGAVLNFNANLQVSNSIFINNSAEFRGGGMDTTFGISSVTNSYFKGNTTNFAGAGLSNFTSTTSIFNSTFENNTAGNRGGGVFNVDGASISDQNATLTLVNNTLSGNTSNGDGGAIYNENAIIDNSLNNTLSNNSANNNGSAIYNASTGSMEILGFLFSQHGGGMEECFNDGGTFTSNIGMTDHSGGGCSATESASINLLPLAGNGCTVFLAGNSCNKTYALMASSAAIDPGTGSLVPQDQRGFDAVGTRDIGAYEFLTPAEQCLIYNIDITNNPFTTTVNNSFELNQAIICANAVDDDFTADTIILGSNIELTASYNNSSTGTPKVTSLINLDGQGFKLSRDINLGCEFSGINAPNEFRLLEINSNSRAGLFIKDIILANGCIDGDGGAIHSRRRFTLENSILVNNHVSGNGGAIFQENSLENISIDYISYTTFENNRASRGGAIYLGSNKISTIFNSTFSGNNATTGAGIHTRNNARIQTIRNVTFSNNIATSSGAGIYNFDSTIDDLLNSLFYNNSGTMSDCTNVGSATITGNNNLSNIDSSDCSSVITPQSVTTGTVGALQDNVCHNNALFVGGICAKTHALLPMSEALDSAISGTPDGQRQFSTSGGFRDVGAFEAFVPSITAPNDINTEAIAALTPVILGPPVVFDPDDPVLTGTPSTNGPFVVGIHPIAWTVTDSYGHQSTDTQTVTITDTTAPDFTLIGDTTINLTVGDVYTELNASAIDLVDGDISNDIIITGTVDTNTAATYQITYNVSDSAGNTANELTRTVMVEPNDIIFENGFE